MINSIINDPHTPIKQKYSKELKELISRMLIKVPEQRPSIKQLIQVQIVRDAITSLDTEFEDKIFSSNPRPPLGINDSSSKAKSIKTQKDRLSYSLKHANELSPTIFQVDLTDSNYMAWLVVLSGERLYTSIDKTLFVYSMSDLRSPLATYPLAWSCDSGLTFEDHLYVGARDNLYVFKVNNSMPQPLTPVKVIDT
jgi:serine/threonine protein kinase